MRGLELSKDTAKPVHLQGKTLQPGSGLYDLALLYALGAYRDAGVLSVDVGFDLLEIGKLAHLGAVVGVANGVSDHRLLPANITYPRHLRTPFQTFPEQGRFYYHKTTGDANLTG
jgi:hypothetical protein